jgi:hypothetical protein
LDEKIIPYFYNRICKKKSALIVGDSERALYLPDLALGFHLLYFGKE